MDPVAVSVVRYRIYQDVSFGNRFTQRFGNLKECFSILLAQKPPSGTMGQHKQPEEAIL
jgi:hypothetical protein